MALSRELLGDNFRKATLELNASDDRGLEAVRDKIKSFAAQKIPLPEGRHKIIILDEADSMTENAQQALRIIISDFSHTTRFALACNDSSKVIEPIQSRCNILRFSKLKDDEIEERLHTIIAKENIAESDASGIKALIDTSDGDMRYALNNLQSTYVGFGNITHENVYKIVDIPKPEIIKAVFDHCLKGDLDSALDTVDSILNDGYNSYDIINVLSKVIQDASLEDEFKFDLLKEVSMIKMRVLDGIDSEAQVYGFVAQICEMLMNKK